MDVKFTHFRFDECVREGLNEFQSFMEEINISLNLDLSPLEVASDRKIVLFMLIQLISKAVKYADDDGRIYRTIQQVKDKIYFGVIIMVMALLLKICHSSSTKGLQVTILIVKMPRIWVVFGAQICGKAVRGGSN